MYQEIAEHNASFDSVVEPLRAELQFSGVVSDDLAPLREDGRHESEEALIVDHRGNLGPAELVEHKLSTMLRGAWLPVSHIRMAPLQGSRNHC